MRPRAAFLFVLLAVADAQAATISGRVTTSGTGAAASGRIVSATRRSSVPPGGAGASIPVEVNATTDGNGNYVLSIPDGTPGAAEMLVYTRSTLHFNELFGGVDSSANVPTVGDTSNPAVVAVDGTGTATGIDFVLDSNRADAMVTMRDGVTRLATTWWRPARTGTWPTIVVRTTYDKEGLTPGQPDFWIPAGYAIVAQDTRGRYASEGIWKPFRDDGWGANRDGYDTIEWVAAQPWSDGHVGTYGGSALGIVQYMAAGAAPPHLDAAWVLVGAPQAYHHMVFQGGSYRKELVDNWLDGQGGSSMKDEYRQHPNDDAYWAVQDLFTRLDVARTPIYHVGGWYDIFDEGTVRAFSVLQDQAAAGARWNQKLRMGPWTHGTIGLNVAGDATYPFNALDGDPQNADLLRWFDFWLKGKDTGILDEPPVRAYAMGPQGLQQTAVGNVWRTYASWPPAAARTKYYLQRRGGLATTLPASNGGSDVFTYDPLDPVPTVGGPNLTIPAGPYDQTAVEGRADVLVFTSDPLSAPVEIAGNVRARLYASSSATDTDWTVKLVDVYPDGSALSVTDGVLRARHRNGFEGEELMTPGTVYTFDVDLWTTSLVFGANHRIRLEVSSSNDTRFDPNPNTGHPFRADTQKQAATNTVWHDPTRASYVELPVVDPSSVSGCATQTSVGGLRVDRAAGTAVTLSWNAAGPDSCLGEYRVFGSNDPTSWARFARNPLARTGATTETLDAPYAYYLVIAGGTNGANGPRN
ncbi:MAG TPA: CocE/NonD family hydrolase [Candidatus Polarisedimenticolaceae bacterium]